MDIDPVRCSEVGTADFNFAASTCQQQGCSILLPCFYFGNVSRQENPLDVALSSFLLTKRKISCIYLKLSIHGILIDFVSCA